MTLKNKRYNGKVDRKSRRIAKGQRVNREAGFARQSGYKTDGLGSWVDGAETHLPDRPGKRK